MLKFFKGKKLLNTWFLSYLVIFLISIVLSIAIVIYSNDLTNESIRRSTNFLLSKTKDSMGASIEASIKLIDQIYVDPDIQSLLNTGKEDNSKVPIDLYNSMETLQRFHIVHRHLYESIVFFEDHNKVLSSTAGAMSPEMFYDLRYKESSMDIANYYDFVHGRYRYEMDIINMDGKTKFMFAQTLPSPEARKMQANVILFYNEALIKDIVTSNSELDGGLIAIKKDQDIIYSTNNEIVENMKRVMKSSYLDQDYEFITLQDQDYIISETTANLKGYSYIVLIPKNTFYQDYNVLRIILGIALSISIILSIGVSFVFARYQYRPVENIMNTLSTKKTDSITSDEYAYINQSIMDSIDKLEQMEHTVEHYRPLIKTTFLKRLLRGETELSEELLNDMRHNEVILDKEQFYVICIDVEDFDPSMIPPVYEMEYAKPVTITEAILSNVFENIDMLNQNHYSVTLDNILVYVMNHDIQAEDSRDYVQSLIDQAQNIVNENFGIDFSTGISQLHHIGSSAINEAWQEAVYALDYKTILGKHSILFYDDIKNTRRYYNNFPMVKREQLINYINMGDDQQALTLLNQIIEENYQEHMAMETIVCLTNDIVSTIVSVFSNEEGSEFLNTVKPNLTIHRARKNGQYIPDVLRDILRKACAYQQSAFNQSEHQNLSNSVKEYIKNNYHDMNLNITLLGEVFNLTPTYLSKIFKEQTGQYLLDYINHIRIKRSKELLVISKESLAKVADQCGYTNANSFIRVFKKVEGITPGNYRKVHRR